MNNEKNWYQKQSEVDAQMIEHWRQRYADAEKAKEVAYQQLVYLGCIAVQHSLEEEGVDWADHRDGGDE